MLVWSIRRRQQLDAEAGVGVSRIVSFLGGPVRASCFKKYINFTVYLNFLNVCNMFFFGII